LSQKSIVVIGAGISGLATAALLAKAGHKVKVIEGSDWIGGKSKRIIVDGQRMDTGPALVTFPGVWKEFLRRYDNLGDTSIKASQIAPIEFEPLSEVGEYFYKGDKCLLPVEPGNKWHESWNRFEAIHGKLDKEITTLLTNTSMSPKAVPAVSKLVSNYGLRLTTKSYLDGLKWLPEGLKEVISIHTLNAGVAPESTLALFATMPAVMATQQVLVPVGGVNEIPLTLEKLARHAEVEIRLNEKVISISKGKVTTTQGSYSADLVISSLDAKVTDRLLGKKTQEQNRKMSCSGVAIYAVLEQDLPQGTKTHSVIMPDDPAALHKSLGNKELPEQSMVFVNYYKAGHIYPNKKSTVAVLITAPADGKHYDINSDFAKRELERVSKVMGLPKNIKEYFGEFQILDPEYFSGWGATGGALYGEARKIWQSGPLHQPKHSSFLRPWLWRVGASTHPGGGIPAVLGGTLIATEKLLKRIGNQDQNDTDAMLIPLLATNAD
jgi:phytoene desaturase